MAEGRPCDEELGTLLEELKRRSGRSYQWIGRQVNASKSTVYRYCTGRSIPPDFGTVERIAKACNADRAEMAKLYRLWNRATDIATVTETETSGAIPAEPEEPGSGGSGPSAPEAGPRAGIPASAPATHPHPHSHSHSIKRRLTVLLSATMAVLLIGMTASRDGRPGNRLSRQPPAQWIAGPAWVSSPAPVPSTLFGVTLNSTTGTMPAFRVGAVRFWDSGTRWASIEPRRGEFDWSVLDRLAGGADRAGLPSLFVMGGTPRWAAPDGPAGPYEDGSRAAPPNSLADWDAFVKAVVHRYRGRIDAYELWVLANDRRFYNGSVETLVEMTRRASRIIRAADPKATVVCPGMGRLWEPGGVAVLRRFAELGGYGYCDVAGIKLYQRTASDPPETMLGLTREVDRVLHAAGVHPRLWSTGTMYEIPLQGSLDSVRATNYAVRFYLVGLYAHAVNVERMYFYNWGGTKIPIVLQAEGGPPTQAALAVEQLQRWLVHARIRSCGHGLSANLPGNVWQCEFTISDPQRSHPAVIRWTDSGTAAMTAEPDAKAVHRLGGATTPVRPGDTLVITEQPVLIEH